MTHLKNIRSGIALLAIALAAGCAGNSVRGEAISAQQGAALWSMTCSQCHNLRPTDQYSAEEWGVIVAHMRTRAGLTRSETEAIENFLRSAAAPE